MQLRGGSIWACAFLHRDRSTRLRSLRVPPVLEDNRAHFLMHLLLVGRLLLLLIDPMLKILVVRRIELVDLLAPIGLNHTRVDVGLVVEFLVPLPKRVQGRCLHLLLGDQCGDWRPGRVWASVHRRLRFLPDFCPVWTFAFASVATMLLSKARLLIQLFVLVKLLQPRVLHDLPRGRYVMLFLLPLLKGHLTDTLLLNLFFKYVLLL